MTSLRYRSNNKQYADCKFFCLLLLAHLLSTATTISGFAYRTHKLSATNNDADDNEVSQKTKINLQHAVSKLEITGVTLKMAFDTSFSVADASEHKSERFTCPQSLDMVHKLRRWSDAVLVGRGTVERDNCTLTVRRVPLLPSRSAQPARVVIDPSLKLLQKKYAMFKDGHNIIIYHNNIDTCLDTKKVIKNDNIELVSIPKDSSSHASRISARAILKDLYSKNIKHVMVEGGPATAIQFLKEKVVDRAILIKAPVTFIQPVSSGLSNKMLEESGLKMLKVEQCGDDVLEYWTRNGDPWPTIIFDDEEANNETWPY